MSDMLEQAMIDAKALKESALEVAEQEILEKYAVEIKGAVESLLEQDGEEEVPMEVGDLEDPMAMGGEEEGDPDKEFVDQLPAANATGEEGTKDKLDALDGAVEAAQDALEAVADSADALVSSGLSGDEDEEVEIDFDQLEAEMDGEEPGMDDMTDREDVMDLDDETLAELAQLAGEVLDEELKVDIAPQKSGWAGLPESEQRYQEELALAQQSSDEYKEKFEETDKQYKELQEAKTAIDKELLTYKQFALKMKSKLTEVLTLNAKLFYINRTVSNDTLNMRQKDKITEAIKKAENAKEAKVLFETLQASVEAAGEKNSTVPKSLQEVLKNKTSLMPRKPSEVNEQMSVSDHWQKLAGITK